MNTKIKTDERIKRLVLAIGKESLPRRELLAALGLRQGSRRIFCNNYWKPAFSLGLVAMQYPGIQSCPNQSYRLTANGLDYLEEIKNESKKEQAEV